MEVGWIQYPGETGPTLLLVKVLQLTSQALPLGLEAPLQFARYLVAEERPCRCRCNVIHELSMNTEVKRHAEHHNIYAYRYIYEAILSL